MPKQEQPKIKLVVREPFADYERGQEIKDAAKIKEILESEQHVFVNKVLIQEA
jgi:hypothetical protein